MKHIKNSIAYVIYMIKRELEIIVESVKFSGKIIINIKNRKIMNVKISRLKIKAVHFQTYQPNDHNNLVESIEELKTGRDPPEIFSFQNVRKLNSKSAIISLNKD
jgi:hypothetical protein